MNKLSILFLAFLSYGITTNTMNPKKVAKQQRRNQAITAEQARIAAMRAAPPFQHDVNCNGCCSKCNPLELRNQDQYRDRN